MARDNLSPADIVPAIVGGVAVAALTVAFALHFDVPAVTALSGAIGAGVPVAAILAILNGGLTGAGESP